MEPKNCGHLELGSMALATELAVLEWLQSQGVSNCIIEVSGQYFKVNATLGITKAQAIDFGFPKVSVPDWLVKKVEELIKDVESVEIAITFTVGQIKYLRECLSSYLDEGPEDCNGWQSDKLQNFRLFIDRALEDAGYPPDYIY